jgi:cardiolipin synthase A/B
MTEAFPPLDVAGNRLTLLTEGHERRDALIEMIGAARSTLRILYYLWEDDESGRMVRDALLAAIRRGVQVSLLVDGYGASNATPDFFRPLVDAQCRFCRFVPRWGRRYLLRNHQKIAIADERTVMVGGFNISDEYFGDPETGAWRDLGLKVEGEGVTCLVDYFEDLFAWAEAPNASIRKLRKVLSQHSITEGKLHWLFGGPTRRLSPWARAVKRDMMRARRLDMVIAYFAPTRGMVRRMWQIARRGQARIVTAAKSDNRWTIGAARHSYWRLLKRGVEIHEYQPTKLHTKLIVIDDVVHIGSANFDMRSLYLNLEMMLRIDDAEFAAAMRRFIDGEIADSRVITLEEHRKRRTMWNRLRWSFAHFVVATADYNLSRRLNFGWGRLGLGR